MCERQAAFSNRAAALLVLGRYLEGEDDCCQALALALAALHSAAQQQQDAAGRVCVIPQDGTPCPAPTPAGQGDIDDVAGSMEQALNSSEVIIAAQAPAAGYSGQRRTSSTFGDMSLLAAAADAAAQATQGPLAHTAASSEAANAALHDYLCTITPAAHQAVPGVGVQEQGQGMMDLMSPDMQGELQQQQQQQQQQRQESQQGHGSLAVAKELAPIAKLLARR